MRTSTLYLENELDVDVHVALRAERGELTITVFGRPAAGTERIPAGQAAKYKVEGELRRCISGRHLNYLLRNRCGRAISFTDKKRAKDGPVLSIGPLLN